MLKTANRSFGMRNDLYECLDNHMFSVRDRFASKIVNKALEAYSDIYGEHLCRDSTMTLTHCMISIDLRIFFCYTYKNNLIYIFYES